MVSCLEGERHALPALVVAEGLTAAGYRVTYIGGDPEPGDLLRQVLLLKPRAVLFSASLTSSLGSQKPLLRSIGAIGMVSCGQCTSRRAQSRLRASSTA